MKAQLIGKKHKKKRKQGFATLEILIAFTVLILCISAVIMVVFSNQSIAVDLQTNIEAISKAQKILEDARATSRNDWDSVFSFSQNNNPYIENLEIGDVDDFIKSALSKVSWQIDGVMHDVELLSLFTDWKDAKDLTCSHTHTLDWTSANILGSVSLGTNIPGTDVDVKNGIAFVAGDSATGIDEDFFVVDVSHPDTPIILRKFNTGPGLVATTVSGNYAYVANASSVGQLQIIDISDPINAYLRKTFKIPDSGNTPISIYYYQRKIFLGLEKANVAELQIIDVSDVDSPEILGAWEFNTAVNAIYVSNGMAYIGTPFDNAELTKLDISDPTHPMFIASYDPDGASGSGKSIARFGKNIYLGRNQGHNELHVMNVDNISLSIASADVGNSNINGLQIQDNLIFLATTDATKEFQVWKLSSDNSSFNFTSSLDLPSKATAIDCEGQIFYLTTDDPTHGLNIISSN